jgi:hypothetical protein
MKDPKADSINANGSCFQNGPSMKELKKNAKEKGMERKLMLRSIIQPIHVLHESILRKKQAVIIYRLLDRRFIVEVFQYINADLKIPELSTRFKAASSSGNGGCRMLLSIEEKNNKKDVARNIIGRTYLKIILRVLFSFVDISIDYSTF